MMNVSASFVVHPLMAVGVLIAQPVAIAMALLVKSAAGVALQPLAAAARMGLPGFMKDKLIIDARFKCGLARYPHHMIRGEFAFTAPLIGA